MRPVVRLIPLLALVSCVGPFGGPDCIDETRALSVRARLVSVVPGAAPADTGVAALSFAESRNHRSKRTSRRDVGWFVGSGLPRGTVTAVHVHEEATGRLVLDVPIDSTHGPAFVITQVFQPRPYPGPLSWEEAYTMLGEGRAVVDVHTTTRPAGHLRGRLEPEFPTWRDFTHAYCS